MLSSRKHNRLIERNYFDRNLSKKEERKGLLARRVYNTRHLIALQVTVVKHVIQWIEVTIIATISMIICLLRVCLCFKYPIKLMSPTSKKRTVAWTWGWGVKTGIWGVPVSEPNLSSCGEFGAHWENQCRCTR